MHNFNKEEFWDVAVAVAGRDVRSGDTGLR